MSTNVYAGTETTTVQFPDVYGNVGQPQTFQTNTQINVTNPVIAGGLQESNPFNIQVNPDTQGLQSPGAVSLWSAASFNPVLEEGLLLNIGTFSG